MSTSPAIASPSPAAAQSSSRTTPQKPVAAVDSRPGSGAGSPSSVAEKGSSPAVARAAGKERIGPYVLGKTLGVGSTGRVKLGTHIESNRKVAIKIIPKESIAKDETASSSSQDDNSKQGGLNKKIEREITIMKLIKHPHVMELYDVYETDKELFLILEHVEGGELFDFLVNAGRLEESKARTFFQQIVYGVDFCHRHLISHRDLKPENLLLDKSKENVKLADFGMASLQVTGRMLETSCGSPHYASPEIIRGVKYHGPAADTWSCGVILYALLTGNLPFDDENIRRLLAKVKQGQYTIPEHVSPLAKDLIRKMLVIDPVQRITLTEVMSHPWFTASLPANVMELNNKQRSLEAATAFVIHDPGIIDREIVASLGLLGWGDEEELIRVLMREDMCPEKVFYGLLCQRKQNFFENYDVERIAEWDVEGGPRRRAESYASLYAGGSRMDLFRSDDGGLAAGSPGGLGGRGLSLGALFTDGNSSSLMGSSPVRKSADELSSTRKGSADELRMGGNRGRSREASIDVASAKVGSAGEHDAGVPHKLALNERIGSGHTQGRRVVSEASGTNSSRMKLLPPLPNASSKGNEGQVKANSPLAASINFFDEEGKMISSGAQSDVTGSGGEINSAPTQPESLPPPPTTANETSKATPSLSINTTTTTATSTPQQPPANSTTTENVPADSAVAESPRFHRMNKGVTESQMMTPVITSTPKRSWFASLFNFKPEAVILHARVGQSVENVMAELVRVLDQCYIKYQQRRDAGFKCKFDSGVGVGYAGENSSPVGHCAGARSPFSGSRASSAIWGGETSALLSPSAGGGGQSLGGGKGCKFKIEIQQPSSSTSTAALGSASEVPVVCKMVITHQQGAYSAFQVAVKRIEEGWAKTVVPPA